MFDENWFWVFCIKVDYNITNKRKESRVTLDIKLCSDLERKSERLQSLSGDKLRKLSTLTYASLMNVKTLN